MTGPRAFRGGAARRGLCAWLLLALGCSAGDRPEPVPDAAGRALALSVDVPFAELEIPAHNRPEGRAPPERIPLGTLRPVGASNGTQTWAAELPIRLRGLFFHLPPDGMELHTADGERIPHRAWGSDEGVRWSYDARRIEVHAPLDHASVATEAYVLSYPLATRREAALNHDWAGLESREDFVRATVQDGPTSRSGLLLPAPGVVAWDVEVPPAGELHLTPGLVAPEVLDAAPSDGVDVVVEALAGKVLVPLLDLHVDPEDGFQPVRVDLSRWAGRSIRLRIRTEPGPTGRFDYAFLGDVQLTSRWRDPKRVVVVFVDTLRPDHLGVYGYDRDTSPSLDALAEDAVVFDEARSVAPWTLPTSRTLLTGRQPELYDGVQTVQHRLREEGWATAMFAGNIYLSANFDIHRDWALHRVVNWPSAGEQVDLALDWLGEQEGRDTFLLLHLMDPHLPYKEPPEYRFRFAGARSPNLGQSFHRGAVLRAPLVEADRAYLIGRYDNNVRYANDELQRLYDALEPDDVVVFLSDHGEEFWEHGGFEHGHTLYDEVLRVPLVIRAPGIAPGRVAEPVSLIDVVPTVLDLAGVEMEGLVGTSLVPAMKDAPGAREALAERATAFGRPLYGDTRWGALRGELKYMTTEGEESLYDLGEDPGEEHDLLRPYDSDPSAGRAVLAEGLGTEVVPALRLVAAATGATPTHDLDLALRIPGGVRAAWVGDDPTSKSSASVTVDGEHLVGTWHPGYRGSREIFVVPAAPLDEVLPTVEAHVSYDEEASTLSLDPDDETVLARGIAGRREVRITRAVAPLPHDEGVAIEGYDPELASMLQAMGYAVGNEEEEDEDEDEDEDE